MEFNDAVMISSEKPEFLMKTDTLAILKDADVEKIRLYVGLLKGGDHVGKQKVLWFLSTATFVSMASFFKVVLKDDSNALMRLFDGVTEKDRDSAVGRVLSEKIKLYYTFRLISSTFNDHNLLKLKKALNEND